MPGSDRTALLLACVLVDESKPCHHITDLFLDSDDSGSAIRTETASLLTTALKQGGKLSQVGNTFHHDDLPGASDSDEECTLNAIHTRPGACLSSKTTQCPQR